MKPLPRIAIGSIFTESNQLGGVPTELEDFERCELRQGPEVLEVETGVVGGMLRMLRENQAQPVPLLCASAYPGGPLSSGCYARLRTELLDRLRRALPVEGVLLPLHGSAVAEGTEDIEGDLIQAVRQIAGPAVPIVATLDLHAHVTPAMVQGADALIAWETYPHRDAFDTGVRGARMLLDILSGRCRPAMAMAKVPVITGAIHGSTEGNDPFAQLMRWTKAHEGRDRVVSTSLFMVHPPLDQPGLGSGGLVITDGDLDRAVFLARQIAEKYWARRFELEPRVFTPEEAIAQGLQVEGVPVVLVEASDCCGGGAAGDSAATLKALLAAGIEEPALVPVVDPEAAGICHRAGADREVEVELGHRLDPRWGKPVRVKGRVIGLSEGRFRYRGGIWDGVEGDMGPSAVLGLGAIRVLVATHATYDWLDEQFRSVHLDPAAAKFIVAKNPMNYRQAYGSIAKAIFVLDTPGPTPATLRHVRYQHLKRPYFPLDPDIPGLEPTILQRVRS